MKSCPRCRRGYPDDAGFCPADGTGLIQASLVPVASTDDARLGLRLCDRYELRRVVADGGMGRVYEGIDRQTNSRVAVKILHGHVAKDEVSLERFKREYEISHALPHEHIVHVTDFQHDTVHDVWILVMEFLEGEELRLVLKREKVLPPERVIRMLSQVAIGLDQAHARQYVHRDLKPDNVFLCGTRDGDLAKLLDFGSVKDKNKQSKKLTVMGTTIGSPYYMAPEQAQGLETLDARADVFALGAIAYEALVGVVPFDGGNGPQILLNIMTKDAKPPSETSPALPPTLDVWMDEALAKNPNARTASVGALADGLGKAFGLLGDHRAWANMPQPDLKAKVDEALSRVMKPAEVVADPFAAPSGGAPAATATPFSATSPSARSSIDQAFAAAREVEHAPLTVPTSRPAWIVPAAIAAGIVFVLILVFALRS
jgi:eukaryotic-like serine/threonine-protein kinase